jgi:hypothetical protein
MKILRKYVFGPRQINTWDISNYKEPNFLSPNLNIDLPVFVMHGNHDLPIPGANERCTSVVEVLDSAGLINYFGSVVQTEREIVIEPVVFRKGGILVCVYALGHIRDVRLKKYFEDADKKITFVEPWEVEGSGYSESDKFYRILVMHQNRFKGHENGAPPKKVIMFDQIPHGVFNLIIWGHEHEARSGPDWVECESWCFQPGSTVATSFTLAESKPKNYAILSIWDESESKIRTHHLKNQRGMWVEQYFLRQLIGRSDSDETPIDEEFVIQKAEEALEEVLAHHQAALKEQSQAYEGLISPAYEPGIFLHPEQPLIRIKLIDPICDCPTLKSKLIQLELKFIQKIANVGDIFWLVQTKPGSGFGKGKIKEVAKDERDFLERLSKKQGFYLDMEGANYEQIRLTLKGNFKDNLTNGKSGGALKLSKIEDYLEIVDNHNLLGKDGGRNVDVLKAVLEEKSSRFEQLLKSEKENMGQLDIGSVGGGEDGWGKLLEDQQSLLNRAQMIQMRTQQMCKEELFPSICHRVPNGDVIQTLKDNKSKASKPKNDSKTLQVQKKNGNTMELDGIAEKEEVRDPDFDSDF